MQAHALKQPIEVRSPPLRIVFHPRYDGFEHNRLAVHRQIVFADECAQLRLVQIEKLFAVDELTEVFGCVLVCLIKKN